MKKILLSAVFFVCGFSLLHTAYAQTIWTGYDTSQPSPETIEQQYGSDEATVNVGRSTAGVGAVRKIKGGPTFMEIAFRILGLPADTDQLVESMLAGTYSGYVVGKWYSWLFPIAILIGVFGVVSAGYTYMTSQGNPEKVQDASSKLTSSILGIIFIVLSLVILQVIMKTLL